MVVVVVLSLLPRAVRSQCHNRCSGHGSCQSLYGVCTCDASWTGVDCSLRKCPSDKAWADFASGVDTAHADTECSNMGICDRKTGRCACRTGFEGLACERMSCPSSFEVGTEIPETGDYLSITDCNGHGVCLSMREAAKFADGISLHREGVDYSLWDADKVFGCACDAGFSGYDCSQRTCPYGDDPLTTGQSDEVQTLFCKCDGCSGTFSLTFRGEETAEIAKDATVATVKAALEALEGVREATIAFDAGTTVCSAAGVATTVTFTRNTGNLPLMSVTNSLTSGTTELYMRTVQNIKCTCGTCTGTFILAYDGEETASIAHDANAAAVETAVEALSDISDVTVTLSSNAVCEATEATTSITFKSTSGDVPPIGVIPAIAGAGAAIAVETADGTREYDECSNRGLCDRGSGTCVCSIFVTGPTPAPQEYNFTASNGKSQLMETTGTEHVYRDCGAAPPFTAALCTGGAAADACASYATTQTACETKACTGGSAAGCSGTGNGFCTWTAPAAIGTPRDCPFRAIEDPVSKSTDNHTCSGHGHCQGSPTFRCDCSAGWWGADCSLRFCPTGRAWFDEATATNVAHAGGAECSNKGLCNRNTGLCACQVGWEGAACERLSCPTGVGGVLAFGDLTTFSSGSSSATARPCNGNGRCLTMFEMAERTTSDGASTSYTYGATNSSATWDAHMITGCECYRTKHVSYFSGPDAKDSASYDCSLAACPHGDDPVTPTLEVQTATCIGTAGEFKLSFDRDGAAEQTAAIAFDATAQTIKDRLEALGSIRQVSVTLSTGTAACAASPGVGIRVTFTSELGDVNALTSDVSALTGGNIVVAETVKGNTKQYFEVQTLTCIATAGSFTLSFRQSTTAAIAFDATAATVKTALQAMDDITEVDVSFSTGTAACAASPGVGIAVTFRSELGDLPAFTATTTSLTGGSAGITVAETQKGDKESTECSRHGMCDNNLGECKCFKGFTSSNHDSLEGPYRDCGFVNNNPNNNPVDLSGA